MTPILRDRYMCLHSDERCPQARDLEPPIEKEEETRGSQKGKTGRGIALRHFSDVFRTTRTRFGAFPKTSTTIPLHPSRGPLARSPRDFTPILMQIGVSYGMMCTPLPLLFPLFFFFPFLSPTFIEITLIYCGTERLPRSIIRLSCIGICI